MFHDDSQQLYRCAPTFPRGLVEIPLNENLRNTQCIHAATSKFYRGEPLRAVGPEGRDVEWIAVASTHDIEPAVSRALHRLILEESVAPAEIVVLVGSTRTSPLRNDSVVGAFELTQDQTAEPGKVLHGPRSPGRDRDCRHHRAMSAATRCWTMRRRPGMGCRG